MNELVNKRKILFIIAIIVFTGLALLNLFDYNNSNEHIFGTDNFYKGHSGEDIDPRNFYRAVNVGVTPGHNECRNSMELASDRGIKTTPAGWITWIGESSPSSIADVYAYGVEGSKCVLKPYKQDEFIIAPGHLKFLNSNIKQTDPDSIMIEAKYGEYVIRWENVKTWWCHIDKDNPKKHTKIVGSKGVYASCRTGYIIGQANAETKVSLFKVDADNNYTAANFEEICGSF